MRECMLTAVVVLAVFNHGVARIKGDEVRIPLEQNSTLIVAPFDINGHRVKMIVDSGSPSVILFSKRSFLETTSRTKHPVSGYGQNTGSFAEISLKNTLTIGQFSIENLAVIVQDGNSVAKSSGADGIIGYELFQKFEVEIEFNRFLTLRLPDHGNHHDDLELLPLQMKNAKPFVEIEASNGKSQFTRQCVMVDTGSTLGILTDSEDLVKTGRQMMYVGLNGYFTGRQLKDSKIRVGRRLFSKIPITFADRTTKTASLPCSSKAMSVGD